MTSSAPEASCMQHAVGPVSSCSAGDMDVPPVQRQLHLGVEVV